MFSRQSFILQNVLKSIRDGMGKCFCNIFNCFTSASIKTDLSSNWASYFKLGISELFAVVFLKMLDLVRWITWYMQRHEKLYALRHGLYSSDLCPVVMQMM